MGIDGKSLPDVCQRTAGVFGAHLDQSSQAKKLCPSGGLIVQPVYLGLRNLKLMMGGVLVSLIPINLHQVHM
jgi:hypothetical protein